MRILDAYLEKRKRSQQHRVAPDQLIESILLLRSSKAHERDRCLQQDTFFEKFNVIDI